ncbi:hypothetical protein A2853_00250 [Candidatus Kaiserbacteria bacterium RIFCSPHIGHO2_01_FULL_55_17]|uniref:Cyclopropane-fatty-acyl-phospholipid synthase n=1 Tax=Candidatus Kaiserbacteria bacterium RIFCSPHIGHO2_01_FULL_55_17 TaxID=1798484 RepID=A0A1F6DAB3_9BACT|nr:MAG: hypothetical protein A2853_00250 [Candidatus Kaiserbacteria bacterium RIFCSPHIGHO2_01_FULL_55_17]
MNDSYEKTVTRVTRRFADAGVRLGTAGTDADIIMKPPAYRHFLEGEMGIGESFQDGLCKEGRMTIKEFTQKRILGRLVGKPLRTKAFQQSIENSPIVARKHYSAGNEYFGAILDPTMQYTCACFYGGATHLLAAQLYKMELLGRKLKLRRGDRVLDIGCGFGGLAKYFHERFGVSVVGITLSHEQATYARRWCAELPIEIIETDYRTIPAEQGRFDKIVTVGMFEHVGPNHYVEFFEKCKQLLAPGGTFLLHSIFGGGMDPWLEANIFPGGELPTKAQVEEAIKGLFMPMDWHWFGRDYDPTLMAWNRNLKENRTWLERNGYDERFLRTQDYFLQSCAARFGTRIISVGQVHLSYEVIQEYEPTR